MAAEDGSNRPWCGETEGWYSTYINSSFRESAEIRPGSPGNTRFMVIATALTFLVANDKMLNKNLTTSFTSTLPLVLLPALQTSSQLFDATSKLVNYTNLGNNSI